MKIGPVDTEIALLIVKKEEINASKIDSPSATLPSGLKNYFCFLVADLEIVPKWKLVVTYPYYYTLLA